MNECEVFSRLRHDIGHVKHNGVEVIGPFGQCKLNDELNDETWY